MYLFSVIIVDVSSLTNGNPDFVLTKHHLDDGIINYNFGKPCVLVFKFGWSKYFNDVNKYLGLSNEKEKLNFPGKFATPLVKDTLRMPTLYRYLVYLLLF